MRSALSRTVPLLPAALLLLFSEWSGTLWSGAQALPVTVGWFAVGAVCLFARRRVSDPLELGRRAGWLPFLLALTVAASLALSPVARAGMTGLLVLPLLLCLPAAFAACWRSEAERSLGVSAVVAVVAVVAGHAGIARLTMGTERAALPLGHHNLLSLWLILLLPVSLVPALGSGWRRALALVAAALGVLALGLSGSLAGALGWLVEVVILVFALRRLFGSGHGKVARVVVPGLLVAAVAAFALAGPRLLAMAQGRDASLLARLGYLGAALRGFAERPLVGWGPGSGAWLLHEHLRPVPGVHPPYEVVTDAHSFWADSLFELGLLGTGVLVATVALFVVRRAGELRRPLEGLEAARRWASVVSIAGGGVCLLVAGAFDVAALAVAAAIPLALGLPAEERHRETANPAGGRTLVWAIAACLLALTPSRIAHWHFDRFLELGSGAGAATPGEREPGVGETVEAGLAAARAEAPTPAGDARAAAARRHLEQAVRFDPAFPLYRFRRAIEGAEDTPVAGLRSAALSARGIGVFWLVAGARAGQAGLQGYREDLERACDLDPLGSLAPFVLAVLAPADVDAPERLARALLSEPRLAASARLDELDLGRLVEDALARIERLEGVPLGWRAAIVEQVRASAEVELGERPEGFDLTLAVDALGSTSLSLYGFRRRPARLPVLSVQVARARADRIVAPSALVLRETSAEVLAPGCRLAE